MPSAPSDRAFAELAAHPQKYAKSSRSENSVNAFPCVECCFQSLLIQQCWDDGLVFQ